VEGFLHFFLFESILFSLPVEVAFFLDEELYFLETVFNLELLLLLDPVHGEFMLGIHALDRPLNVQLFGLPGCLKLMLVVGQPEHLSAVEVDVLLDVGYLLLLFLYLLPLLLQLELVGRGGARRLLCTVTR
jgi:hypothetical protein